jgi:hypothetical protein
MSLAGKTLIGMLAQPFFLLVHGTSTTTKTIKRY